MTTYDDFFSSEGVPGSMNFLRLPSLSMLRTFSCAARHGSFTLAAEELNLTQSAVSRQIKELELLIGAQLFRRVGRRVILSDAGQSFSRDLEADLARIQETTRRAMIAGKSGRILRIATLPTFGARWLIPRLNDFCQMHPGVEISISTRPEPFSLTTERFDAAIHFGRDNWPDAEMTHLCTEHMIAVASPACQSRHLRSNGTGLAEAPLLHLESRPSAWRDWLQQMGIDRQDDISGKQFDQFSMLISAAVQSLGVALVPSYLIEQELASGLLLPVSAASVKSVNAYYVVCQTDEPRKIVRDFVNWIAYEAKVSSESRIYNISS